MHFWRHHQQRGLLEMILSHKNAAHIQTIINKLSELLVHRLWQSISDDEKSNTIAFICDHRPPQVVDLDAFYQEWILRQEAPRLLAFHQKRQNTHVEEIHVSTQNSATRLREHFKSQGLSYERENFFVLNFSLEKIKKSEVLLPFLEQYRKDLKVFVQAFKSFLSLF